MITFPQLLKEIRSSTGMTQQQFANILGVSKILLVLLETGKKEPSRKFINQLAKKLHVHPISIMPFLAIDEDTSINGISGFETKIIMVGEFLQKKLIKQTSQYFNKNA